MGMEHIYRIGIITTPAGISDQQREWLKQHLTWMMAIRPEQRVQLVCAGFKQDPDHGHGVTPRLWKHPQVAGTALSCIAIADKKLQDQVEACFRAFRTFDEIWCMPGYGQTTYLHRTRPMAVYRTHRVYEQWPERLKIQAKVKLIPPWVELYPAKEKSKPTDRKQRTPWK